MSHFFRILVLFAVGFSFSASAAWMTQVGYFPLTEYEPQGQVHELKNAQVENQHQSEECFLFAFTNDLEAANVNVYGREKSPGISGPYLFAAKLLEYIRQSYQLSQPRLVLEGGNVPDALELVHIYGLVPDRAWRPKKAFYNWPFETLYKAIEKSIRAEKKKLENLKFSKAEYSQALEEAQATTSQIVFDLTGELPQNFIWQDEKWTPQEFAQSFGPQQAHLVDFYQAPNTSFHISETTLRHQVDQVLDVNFSIHHRDWNEIEARMVEALDAGVPILVSMKWGRAGGHVLTAVGYELRHGKVFAWKFVNSWGNWAQAGEAYFKASDIRHKADQVWILH